MTETEPRLVICGDRGGGGDAEIVGVLPYLDHAQCFVLETPLPGVGDGTNRTVAVWPPDVAGFGPVSEGE